MGVLSFARRPSHLGVCFGCGILYQTIASYHLQKDKTLSSAVIICIYPASVNFVISNRSTKGVMSNRSYKERNPSTHTPGIRTTTTSPLPTSQPVAPKFPSSPQPSLNTTDTLTRSPTPTPLRPPPTPPALPAPQPASLPRTRASQSCSRWPPSPPAPASFRG